jgi:hypothetical protein
LSKIVPGDRCGFYVSNGAGEENMTLFPGANVSSDTIVFIKYTDSANINLLEYSGVNSVVYFN